MEITVPKIQSKYITAFKNESSYDTAYPTFEEVNWSAIKPAVGPEELPDEYRLSRRLSHMYVNGTPPDFKFSSVNEYVPYDAQTEEEKTYADAHQIAHHNTEGCPANQMTSDDIRETFFLEIVWGYSGWEWHDYNKHEEDIDYSYFTLKNDSSGKYMNITEEGVFTSDVPQILHSTIENGHTYITDITGNYYIGWADNLQDTSSDPNDKVYLELIQYEDKDINYIRLKTPKGFIDVNGAGKCIIYINWLSPSSLWVTEYKNESPFEVIQGGNLYKIKDIQTVPHIIDGHRLQHINDFLNSQTSVIHVEDFDVDTLVSINRAFKRINQQNGYTLITPCQLDVYEFPLVEEADGLFFNNKISIADGHTFNMPLIKQVDSLYAQGAYTEGLKFKMESLTKLTNCFWGAYFNQGTININNIFEGTSLNKVTNFRGLLYSASIYGYNEVNGEQVATIHLDLTGSTVPIGTTINLSRFASCIGVCGHNTSDGTGVSTTGFTNRRLIINLDFSNNVDLSYGIATAMITDKYSNILKDIGFVTNPTLWYRNGSFNKLTFNINNKEALVKDLNHFGAYNTFIENLPITSRCNADCNDDYIYQGAVCNANITYDFSPTQSISYYYSQFNKAEIKAGFTFSNIDCLKSVDFRNTKFPVDTTDPNNPVYTTFPYVLNNPNYTYNQDSSRYQNISFEGSNLAGFAVQDFYLQLGDGYDKSERNRKTETEWGDICSNCFKNMKNVDFTANHKLYIKNNIVEPLGRYVQYNLHLFDGCSSMITTPTVYYTLDTTNADNNVYADQHLLFNGCNELVSINCENLNLIGGHLTNPETNITSKKLVYLKLGRWDCSIKIASKILDIPTFKATLDRQYRTNKVGSLTVMKEIYDLLAVEYTTYEGVTMNYNEYCSHVYSSYNYVVDPSY